jgi:hypothetical protein
MAKRIVPPARKSQQQPASPALETGDQPATSTAVPAETPYDRVGYLADARLKIERGSSALAHLDAINSASRRALAIVQMVEEATYSDSGSEFPTESLREAMDIVREEVEVAKRLADSLYDLYREAATAKAD